MLSDQLGQQERRDGGDNERDHHERERMRESSAIAAFTLGKRRDELRDARTEVDWQAKYGPELDDDGVHLPVAAGEVEAEELLGDAEMRGGAYGKKLGETFNDAQDG